MDNRTKAPYLAQDPAEIGQVVAGLNAASKKGKSKGGFNCRKRTYQLSANDKREVDSWSMNDWDYKKPDLPTYARGLFTHSNNDEPEIAVRGYDKFFNVGEVNKTQWRNVEHNTRGPYELSVKENGCIIFIAGLDGDTIIVTSKHSTGPRQDDSANHAHAGEQWIDRQLKAIGKTRSDLAKELRSRNVTAVAELCDDSFEEHVLKYTPEHSGLYLHGINLNLPEFATYPGNLVHKFADEWGFKKAQYVMKETMDQVKPFLDKVGETGNFEGRDTEGFVIRCQARENQLSPWVDWFFKYKFEEPYLMYRQWREVTKAIISGKAPKYNKHQKITAEYITYARKQLAKDPQLGKAFQKNHGIIGMREGFLSEKGLRGHEIIQSEEQNGEASGANDQVTHSVIIAPVATIGCGKTTVALALVKLFGWGHIQNDNIEGKGRPRRFAQAITNAMAAHPAVIADRNNHQRRERAQLFEDTRSVVPDAKYICLHYVHDQAKYADIRRAMQERIFSRGDRHQTIHAGTKGHGEIQGIMDGFLTRFEPVTPDRGPDQDFDQIIDLDVTATSRENLATVIHRIHDTYPKLFDLPTEQALDDAITHALNYAPTIKHDLSKPAKENNQKKSPTQQKPNNQRQQNGTVVQKQAPPKPPRIEFFGVYLPAPRISYILDVLFGDLDASTSAFYKQLKASNRVQTKFHVTLMHRASEKQHPEVWKQMNEAFMDKAKGVSTDAMKGGTDGGVEMGKCDVQLERVVWDGRVMAVVARLLGSPANTAQSIPGADKGAAEKVEWKSVNETAHVTVGTTDEGIKAKESNELLARWRKGEGGDQIRDVGVKGRIVVEGSVRGLLSR